MLRGARSGTDAGVALALTAPHAIPTPGASATPGAPATPASPGATPTPPPITVEPASATVPVGSSARVVVGSAIAPISAVVHDPSVVDAAIDQTSSAVTLSGKKPGATVVTVTDARGLTRDVAVRVAYYAGSVASQTTLSITGDPASADFIRQEVAAAVVRAAQARPGAQIVVSADDVSFSGTLAQDRVAVVNVPVLIQGTDYIEVDATTRVDVRNVAAPRISPDSLMVSDYPERLEENGILFTADLRSDQPSRFLYFHYNPPGQPPRRVVLRVDNTSPEPASVQFISGRGGPTANEMEAGHSATRAFLIDVMQNQGRLITIPGNSSLNIAEQDLPPGTIVCNLLQLRALSGNGSVHLTLTAQPADADIAAGGVLLEAEHKHARGIYPIPEFYYAAQWNVNDDYLEVPIGQIPLPNDLQGQALAGDYGVLQSFVVTMHNPLSTPQVGRHLRKSARRPLDRNLHHRRRAGAVASSSAVFALQNSPVRHSGARIRARHHRDDTRRRIELSAAADLRTRRRKRLARRVRLSRVLGSVVASS